MCNHDKPQPKKPKQRHGSALEHGRAHQQDHQDWSRRTFLRQMGIAGTASFFLGNMPITALASSPLALALNNDTSDRILVLIRLKGGNDGLNTIIPLFDYGTYQSNRPTIAIPQNEVINLSNELGMPTSMQPLENLWQDGQMKVINNVGYAAQNLSHFRSTDIWSSASDSNVVDNTGWMGRTLEQEYPDFLNNPPADPPAIQMGSAGNLTFVNSDELNMALMVADPEQLYQIAQTGQLYDPNAVPTCYYGEQLHYLRVVANNTFRYAEVVAQAYENGDNAVEHQNFGIGDQLALVARLIRGGLGTRLYMVTHDGFDTHANQPNQHPLLMNYLAQAVDDFYADLAAGGHDNRVLSMTFSEFGRRPEQNASNGTDHGAAAPMMVFGPGLEGNGFLGGLPDMVNLDNNGNLPFEIDFRQVYATVLEQWLCLEPDQVDLALGETFERLDDLGLNCTVTSTSGPGAISSIGLQAFYYRGFLNVEYHLPEGMPVEITLFNMLGQPMRKVFSGYQPGGSHQQRYPLNDIGWASGIYVCTVRAGGQIYSKQIRLTI
jgi:uncharacterized protein (DUF1501 family)